MKGNTATSSSSVMNTFDVVIRTQEEFNILVASPTWLDAKSVCFVGNGGTLKFTRTVTGLKIPPTVKQIQGRDNAIIEVTGFVYNITTNKAALWYAIRPTTDDYSIRDLTVNCTSTGINGYGFSYCTQLTNCTGTSTNGYGFSYCTQLTNCTGTSADGYGFFNCSQLTNCVGTGTTTSAANACGFSDCSQLTNCTGTGISDGNTGEGYGFYNCNQLTNCIGASTCSNGWARIICGFSTCTQLTNCTGTGTSNTTRVDTNVYGFYFCDQLINCTGIATSARGIDHAFNNCTQLTNCTGTGTANGGTGYGFYDCKWINGCKQGTASTTSFLGGTNTKVDTLTVIAV